MIVSPEWMDIEKSQDFLRAHLHPFEGRFANEEPANNHLNIAYAETQESYREEIALSAARMLIQYDIRPQFIAAVPTGATGWGRAIGNALSVLDHDISPRYIDLSKKAKREFDLPSDYDERAHILELAKANATGIVVDDASSDGGTSEAFADFCTAKGFDVAGILVIVYRGETEPESAYNRYAVMQHHIPRFINWNDWRV